MDDAAVMRELVLIIVLGGSAQWLAWRLRLPSILLLLLFGFLAGPVTHMLHPDALLEPLLLPLVSLSVAVILFDGGLTLNLLELRRSGRVVRNLVSVGALGTWLVGSAAAYLLIGLELRLAVLLGAILVVTGPTVIMPLLRHVRPTGAAGAILKWEGIVIDPLGALLTVLVFNVLFSGHLSQAPAYVAVAVLKTVVIGGGLGLLAAGLLTITMARYWVPEFLHNAVALVLVCAAFAISNRVQAEAGLLAVTVMGIAMANQRLANTKHIREFKENLTVFLISALFIVLAARVNLDDLRGIGLTGVWFVAVLVLVARPLSVAISTIGSGLSWRERLFLAWVAPRGIVAAAVASVFAIHLQQTAGCEGGRLLVPLTFITIVGTVLVYGSTAGFVAHRLGVADRNPQGVLIVGAHPPARAIAAALQARKLRTLLVDTNYTEVAAARMAGLPAYHGSILGEQVLEEIDLGGIGRLLALTPNDEVNVLAVQRFAPIFGRAAVYQVPPQEDAPRRAAMDKRLHGRWLFSPRATGGHLLMRLQAGDVVKATGLTDSFDYKAFRMTYGPDALPLFVLTETGLLNVVTAQQPPRPRPGQTLISLVSPKREGAESVS